jgi:amino acid transporter
MVSYKLLNVGDPLAFVFGPDGANIPWISGIIAVSAIIAIATVLLVFQLGQPRLWMAMSRDGLLPRIFSAIHPKFRTPWFSTILTGVMVAVPALFMNLSEVTELSVIGTLFAFIIVCAGVLVKDKEFAGQKRFVPYINSQWIAPVLFIIVMAGAFYYNGDAVVTFLTDYSPRGDETAFGTFLHKIPYFAFIVYALVMTALCFVHRLSLIPVLGVTCCSYLMAELSWTNWFRFGIWLIVGLVLYFAYGYWNSRLHKREDAGEPFAEETPEEPIEDEETPVEPGPEPEPEAEPEADTEAEAEPAADNETPVEGADKPEEEKE